MFSEKSVEEQNRLSEKLKQYQTIIKYLKF